MKKIAQSVSSIVFLSIVVKGFFTNTNAVDAIILIASLVVFCMYEFLTEQKRVKELNDYKKEVEEYKKETSARIFDIQKSIDHTKDYVSKISTAQAFRK